jgi:hypothetical protein
VSSADEAYCAHPKPYLADILTKLVNGWPMAKVDELLPWA